MFTFFPTQQSPGEIKGREVELGSHRELDNPLLQLFLSSCFSDTVLVTLFRTAVETAVSEVHKLLCTGGVLTSLTSLFWGWLTVSSVFTGQSARTSYSCPPPSSLPTPFSCPLISLVVFVDVKYCVYLLTSHSVEPKTYVN